MVVVPTSSQVVQLDATPGARWANHAVKATLVALFAVALFVPLDALEGKAMAARAPVFLAPAVVVPVIASVRRWDPYPHVADALLSAPFAADTLGNVLGFYDEYPVTDDVLHAVNWVLLVGAFHAFRFRNVTDRRDAVLLGCGFGALAIVGWEAFEWVVSDEGLGGAGGLSLTYGDTIGDLVLSTTGGLVGSLMAVGLLGPVTRDRPPGSA